MDESFSMEELNASWDPLRAVVRERLPQSHLSSTPRAGRTKRLIGNVIWKQ